MDDEYALRQQIAQDRFGIIAPVINGTFSDASKTAYYRRVAQHPLRLSNGKQINVCAKTLAHWERSYRKFGFEGLVPQKRSDQGRSRVIDEDLSRIIDEFRAAHPSMKAPMVFECLVEKGEIAYGDLSVSSLRRYMKNHPLDLESAQTLVKDRRAWQAAHVNDVWQADTMHFLPIGHTTKSYIQFILDDKSRKIVGASVVSADNAITFQATFKAAIAAAGLPKILYVDHGGSYDNDQLGLICARLGIELMHPKPYDAAAKGKVERLNRTCRMRFSPALTDKDLTSFETANDALSAWVLTYNTTIHSATKQAPADMFLAACPTLRFAPSKDYLDEMFLHRVKRKVAKDSTVRLNSQVYDAPCHLIGQSCEVFFDPTKTDAAWIVGSGTDTRFRLVVTDKVANGRLGRKKPSYSIDYSL